jgi:SAM-dependent methyltransferase
MAIVLLAKMFVDMIDSSDGKLHTSTNPNQAFERRASAELVPTYGEPTRRDAAPLISISMFTRLQVGILRRIAPPVPLPLKTVYDGKSKLAMCFGPEFLNGCRGKTVVDFGCGNGLEVIELAKAGAELVIGIEIDECLLTSARQNAAQAGVGDRCLFVPHPDRPVDMVVSLDCFEHYADPVTVLRTVYAMLRQNGIFQVSFGPPWYHPWGEHLIELPPWAHVFFSESAVVRWRQLMRGGDATSYAEIGLNQMKVAHFERLAVQSGFEIDSLEVVPIKPLRWIHNRFTREFTTSVVRAVLRKL